MGNDLMDNYSFSVHLLLHIMLKYIPVQMKLLEVVFFLIELTIVKLECIQSIESDASECQVWKPGPSVQQTLKVEVRKMPSNASPMISPPKVRICARMVYIQ